MAVVLYGIPNCDTVKKARAWLDSHGISHAFHDFKKAGATEHMLQAWLKGVELDVLLNRKGTTWRGLSETRKASAMDVQGATALMLESPSVIKRPVLSLDGAIHVGFSADAYQQIFKNNL